MNKLNKALVAGTAILGVLTINESKASDGEMPLQQKASSFEGINYPDSNGLTPLHFAVKMNFLKKVTWLLGQGTDINAKDNNGKTPLHIAVEENNREIVEVLISKGADVNAKG